MHESYSQPSLTPSGGSVSRAKRQTDTLTLRIDKELLDELRKESDEKLLSLNTLANQIIKLYIKWYSPAQRAGIMFIPKCFLASIMETLADYEVSKISDEFKKSGYKETLLLMSKEYSLSVILELFDTWLHVSNMQYSRELNEGTLTYIINHGLGKKWSLLLEKSFGYLVNDLGINEAKFYVTNGTVTIKLNV